MKCFVLRGLLALAVLTALPAAAFAQATGQITGTVTDENGQPLKGVKVVAKSPTQIGGARTTYSNDEGSFRFLNLLPGNFEVSATSQGLDPVVQKGVRVDLVSPTEIYLAMKVETKEEVITVQAPAPIVNTSKAVVKETYDAEFLDALPMQSKSTNEDILANQVPGTVGTNVRGGNSDQNVFKLEGFQVNTPGGGGLGQIVPLQGVASFEVSGAGYGAENATAAGSVTNMATKSGSNKFEVVLDVFHEDSALYFFKDSLDNNQREWHFYSTLTVGGPIVKDKLWFFVLGEFRSNVTSAGKDPTGLHPDPPPSSDFSFRGIPKLTWQVTPRNTLTFLNTFNRDFFKNGGNDFQHASDALWRQQNLQFFSGLIWKALLSDSLVFQIQAGASVNQNDFGPQLCATDPTNCDNISPYRQLLPSLYYYNNFNNHNYTTSNSFEIPASLEWFHESKAAGSHTVKFTARHYQAAQELKQSTPGDVIYVFNGLDPFQSRRLFVNNPFTAPGIGGWKISDTSSNLQQFSLTDQWKPPRYKYLTITPGVGLVRSHAEDGQGNAILDFVTPTPHLSVAWDATQDGRTAVRGSFNQYIDPGTLAVAGYVGADRVVQACNWNPVTQKFDVNCTYTGGPSGKTIGMPCGPDDPTCKEKLNPPRTTEITAGVEREVVQGVSLGADFIYRRFDHPFEDVHTNRIWNTAGTALDPTGGYRNGRPIDVVDLETPDSAKRRYVGVTASVRKREGRFKINASYTWSQLKGNVWQPGNPSPSAAGTLTTTSSSTPFANLFLNNPGQDQYLYGYLPGDSRHSIRTQSTWDINPWLTGSVIYNYTSGTIYNHLYQDIDGNFTLLRSQVGTTLTVANDPSSARELRLPDVQDLGLGVRVNLQRLTRFNAMLSADVLNALALRTTTSVIEQDGQNWGTPASRLKPFRVRLGFNLRF